MFERRAMQGSSQLAARGSSRGQLAVAGWQAEQKNGESARDRSVTWASEARGVRTGSGRLGGSLRRAGASMAKSPASASRIAGDRSSSSISTVRTVSSRAGDASTGGHARSPSLDRPRRARRGPLGRSQLQPPGSGSRPFRQSGMVHHDPLTGGVLAHGASSSKGRKGTQRPPSKASTLVPKEHLPKLVGDDRLGSVPVEQLRVQRWDELRWLHALLVRQGKQPSGLAEYLSLEGGIRRTLFIVNMTGYAGVPDRIIGDRASALFKSFDLSRSGIIDPRELQCCLRIVDKPHDTPVQLMTWCMQFYAVKRPSDG